MVSPDPAGAPAPGTGSGTAASSPAAGASGATLTDDQVQEKLKRGEELSWDEIMGSTTASATKPENGGLWCEADGTLVPWVGMDPDHPANTFAWDKDKKTWKKGFKHGR